MKLIGKKYNELTQQQIINIMTYVHADKGPWRFTVEEITKDEALGLLEKFYSFDVAEVVPEEFLDDEEFMMEFVSRVYPVTYPSALAYASDRLKNKPDFVSFCIEKHGSAAVIALLSKNKTSKLLSNKKFVLEELRKDRYKEVDGKKEIDTFEKEFIAKNLAEYSTVIKSNKSLIIEAIRINPESYFHIDEELSNDEDILIELFKSILERDGYYKWLISKVVTDNKKLKHIKKLCLKIAELPSDSKLRRALYKKLANKMIEKLEVKEQEEGLSV